MDKYIFQIVQKGDDVLIIINDNTNKFIAIVNEDTFKLPYLKNKDMVKFVSKILDKHTDSILKLNYSLEIINTDQLKLNISVNDGKEHKYEVILKSKDTLDEENLIEKIDNVKKIYDDKILNLDRKYDDICDQLELKINSENNNLKTKIQTKHIKSEYRNYKFKSLEIIKSLNKMNKTIEIFEEIKSNNSDDIKLNKINNNFYEEMYNEVKNYDDFINFIHMKYNEKQTNDPIKKVKYVYNYFIESNIFNILEFIFNLHGTIQIIYLNLEFNKSTQKLTTSVKFLYDNSELKNYKCLPSLYNQDLPECKLIYHNNNNQKKDIINVFIFEKIK